MGFRSVFPAFLAFVLLAATRAAAIEFDCIALPANPQERPADCDLNPDPSGWCNCLKTFIANDVAGEPSSFSQAMINVVKEPTIGTYTLVVDAGTLDLSTVTVGDSIGEIIIDVPIPDLPENFYLQLSMQVTEVQVDYVEFDITVVDTNEATKAVLTYDPTDAAHANGITYRGTVQSPGPGAGFTLTFAYVDDVTTLPGTATDTGLERGDLTSPNFTVPMELVFPTPNLYALPLGGTVLQTTTLNQIVDPLVARTFEDLFEIRSAQPSFRRADANRDKKIDLTDAILTLGYLFQGTVTSLGCHDAADANGDGKLDLTDPVATLNYLFVGGISIPDPGPVTCGPDPDIDSLPECEYQC